MGFVSYQEDIVDRHNSDLGLVERSKSGKAKEGRTNYFTPQGPVKQQIISQSERLVHDVKENKNLQEQLKQQKNDSARRTICSKDQLIQKLSSEKDRLIENFKKEILKLEKTNNQLQKYNDYLIQ